MSVGYRQILDTARRAGLLSDQQIDEINADTSGRSPLVVAEDLHYASEDAIARAVAERYNCRYVDLAEVEPNIQAQMKLSLDTMRRDMLVPIALTDDAITIAMVDPADIISRDDVRSATRLGVTVCVSTETAVLAALDRYEANQTNLDSMVDLDAEAEQQKKDEVAAEAGEEDTVVAKLMSKIIADAINLDAGDIYIEPHENEMAIRFRIDGVCREIFTAPKAVYRQFINRLKIQCNLDISEHRKPQDGRFGVTLSGKVVDFRVAVLPTIYGELAVLRLLRRDSIMLSLAQLGFREDNLLAIKDALVMPHGMILVTGPTGSGKSTTLYAAINETTDPTLNLITVEDPVEYRLEGLSQVQVHERAGLTFAAALRSILRQDPDQVMIGEIRDAETGNIAIEAALTGHLVLSTLHTNDAPSTLTRLTDMGIEPYLSASAILLVVAQRLARRLCPECKTAYQPDLATCKELGFPYDEKTGETPTIYKPVGCRHCNGIGYRGRMGIHEVMKTSEEIERLIVHDATADEIRAEAIKEGMQTLRDDGFAKVLEGLTSIEEILRVVA